MEEKESRVRSVARALAILKCFFKPPHEMGITELSERLQLSKGTVHLLVKTLEDEGFLEQVGETKKYRVGPLVHDLGMAALGGEDLRIVSRKHLQQLSYELSMPCYLATVIGGQVVLIEKAEPVIPFMVVLQIGAILPYHTTSMGKVLLAFNDSGRREQLVGSMDLTAMTPNTITSREQLKKELEGVIKLGYAMDREETLPGVFCLAVPVKDGRGRVVAALSLIAPSTTMNEDNHARFLPAMEKCSAAITGDISYMKG